MVIDDDKINLFFLIRFMSENLSKLAHREAAQFIPASDARRKKTWSNALSFCSKRGHICPTH